MIYSILPPKKRLHWCPSELGDVAVDGGVVESIEVHIGIGPLQLTESESVECGARATETIPMIDPNIVFGGIFGGLFPVSGFAAVLVYRQNGDRNMGLSSLTDPHPLVNDGENVSLCHRGSRGPPGLPLSRYPG
jgi:hypothetical protein